MAEFLVLPAEVDPALTEEYLDLTRPIFGPIPLAYLLADTDSTIEQIGAETGIIAGFSTARFTKDGRARMVHAVLRFRDAAGVGEAAEQLHERLLAPRCPGRRPRLIRWRRCPRVWFTLSRRSSPGRWPR